MKPVQLRARVVGLDEGTEYHFQLVCVSGGRTFLGGDREFKTIGTYTPPPPPEPGQTEPVPTATHHVTAPAKHHAAAPKKHRAKSKHHARTHKAHRR